MPPNTSDIRTRITNTTGVIPVEGIIELNILSIDITPF